MELAEVLILSQSSQSNIRTSNEAKIKEIRDRGMVSFIQSLTHIVINVPTANITPEDQGKIRALAAILYKNTLF